MYPNQPGQPDVTPGVPPVTPLGAGSSGQASASMPVKGIGRWIIVGAVALLLGVGLTVWLFLGPRQATSTTPNDTPAVNTTTPQGTATTTPTQSTFNPQVGQTKPQVDAAAAADGRLPLCTVTGTGTAKRQVCQYTATSAGTKFAVTFVGGVVTEVTK